MNFFVVIVMSYHLLAYRVLLQRPICLDENTSMEQLPLDDFVDSLNDFCKTSLLMFCLLSALPKMTLPPISMQVNQVAYPGQSAGNKQLDKLGLEPTISDEACTCRRLSLDTRSFRREIHFRRRG